MAAASEGRSLLHFVLTTAALSLSVATLHAQTPASNPFVGKWQATFKVTTTTGLVDERHSDIEITPNGGTWQARVQTRNDPCAGKQVPIAIDQVTDDRLTGTVRYSTLGDFCKDAKLTIQRDAAGKYTGKRGTWPLELERK